jgi:hypothetical protein
MNAVDALRKCIASSSNADEALSGWAAAADEALRQVERAKNSDHPLRPEHVALESPLSSAPDFAVRPLTAETLKECKRMLQRRPQDFDEEAFAHAIREVERLEDMMTPSGPVTLKDGNDASRYLKKKFEQFELLGKLRLSNGGSAGGNVKPITNVVNFVLWVVGGFGLFALSPKLRLEGARSRNAVFELAMSPVGLEIFVGKESKTSSTFGLGMGASSNVVLAGIGASGEKGLSGERIWREGFKAMIPRSPSKAYTDDEARLEAKAMVDAIFHGAPECKNEDDFHGVPANLAAIFAACPNVSIAMVDDMSDRSVKQDSAGNLLLSGKLAVVGDKQAGGTFGGGGRNVRISHRTYNASEKSGYHKAEYRIVSYGGQSARQLAASATASTTAGGGGKASFGAGMSLWSRSEQNGVAGANMKLRLISVDGKTHPPITWRDIEFADVDEFARRIEARREDWVQLAMEQMFKGGDRENIPVDEQRQRAAAALDETLATCRQMRRTSEGNEILRNVYLECYCMTEVAARAHDDIRARQALAESRIDAIERHIETLKANPSSASNARSGGCAELAEARRALKDAKAAMTALIDAQNALLYDDATWKPWKLAVVERTQETSQTGIDFFLKTGAVDAAEGQVMHLLWPWP